MALQLKFNICQSSNCKNLTFTEDTGKYESTYNLTGYGAPNIETTDVLTAVLTITNPSGTITTVNLFTQGFPIDDLTLDGFVITNSTALVDGKYTFLYTITTLTETYTKSIEQLLFCNVANCVSQLLADLSDKLTDSNCDCCDEKITNEDYLKASIFLQALKNAAKCSNYAAFNKLLKILAKICKNKCCKTCK